MRRLGGRLERLEELPVVQDLHYNDLRTVKSSASLFLAYLFISCRASLCYRSGG
jgi:hypothetical protein